jgi:hypothetical protein
MIPRSFTWHRGQGYLFASKGKPEVVRVESLCTHTLEHAERACAEDVSKEKAENQTDKTANAKQDLIVNKFAESSARYTRLH